MNDAQNNYSPPRQSSSPISTRQSSWTSRIILSALACAVGLWLGMGTHAVTASAHQNGPSGVTQSALADVFSFDILLAGKESKVKPVRTAARPQTTPVEKCNLPAAFVAAQNQRPEPVYAAMPKTLSPAHARFMLAPPNRPAGPWKIDMNIPKLDAQLAGLAQAHRELQVRLARVPGMSAAEKRTIQVEVDRACNQIDSLRRQDLRQQEMLRAPEPPQPAADFQPAQLTDFWPDRGGQLMH